MKFCSVCYRCYEDRAVHCADGSHHALLEPRDGSVDMIAGYRLERSRFSTTREEVFSARHMASERSCIVRILRGSTARVADFLRDAGIATSLFHPNVVDVYEAGQLDQGDLFVVTEDAAGRTLREMLNDGVPDMLTTIRIATELASAVHTLHLKSLVHRAIRPENIVITTDGCGELLVRLKDADLGGLIEHSIVSDKFTIDLARDHLRYFSPEQCNGESVGIKADVYSLGIVLYEMLAGRTPFDSPKASGLIEMHRHRRPAEIRIDDFELRMLVTHTLMQSLSKHPSDRQSSANAFARQLRHVEQLSTHVSTPPPAGIVPPEPVRSSPRIHISDASQAQALDIEQDVPQLMRSEQLLEMPALPMVELPPNQESINEKAPSIRQRLSKLRSRRQRSQSIQTIGVETVSDGVAVNAQAKAAMKPAKISWEQPEDDIPAMEAVLAARFAMPELSEETTPVSVPERVADHVEPVTVQKADSVRVAAAAASTGIHLSGIFGTSHHEPDEVTAAPARGNPIRINIGASKPATERKPVRSIVPSPTDESSYFPSFLSSEPAPSRSQPSASILSAFYGNESARFAWPIQKVTLAVGIVAAAAAIFAFNNASAWKYFSRSPVSGSDSAAVSQPDPVQQQADVTSVPEAVHKRPVKFFDGPQAKTNSNSAVEVQPNTPLTANKKGAANDAKPDKQNRARPTAADRVKSSMKPELLKRAGAERSPAATKKLTATTRPRIVKSPRP